jgi:hypothetical protein
MPWSPALRDALTSPHLMGVYGLEVVHQTLPAACGCACVATALRHFGMYASERMIVDGLTPNRVTGITPEQILRFFSDKGLLTSGFSGYPADQIIDRAKLGRITLIRRTDRGDHWMIPVGIEPLQQVLILADPSEPAEPGRSGESALSVQTFDAFTADWEASRDVAILVDTPGNTGRTPRGIANRRTFLVVPYGSATVTRGSRTLGPGTKASRRIAQ